MKRFYVAPVIGDGTEFNPYRPKVANYAVNWSVILPSKPDGTPLFPWCLVIVGAPDHTALVNDVDLDAFPEITLDSTLSVLNKAQRDRLLGFLTKRGVDTSGLTINSTFRDVLVRIGGALDANFKTEKFDVAE